MLKGVESIQELLGAGTRGSRGDRLFFPNTIKAGPISTAPRGYSLRLI